MERLRRVSTTPATGIAIASAPPGIIEDATASRRQLLNGSIGLAASVAAYAAGLDESFAQFGVAPNAIDVGGGDFGVLNYAYTLEQLESEFYTLVVQNPYRGMNAYESQVFNGIRGNEVAHRDFLATALNVFSIGKLQFDFSRVNFANRASVLAASQMFEDLGVSAYNGAGQLLRAELFLSVAGAIVSVEARQAAIIRDLIRPLSTSFAGDDIVNAAGLEVPPRAPSQVLARAGKFIASPVTARQLP